MDKDSINSLKAFSGRTLQSVEFILDYLQLHFDGATITAVTWPSVQVKGMRYQYDDKEYKNALCGFIGQQLNFVQISEEDKALLQFTEDSSLTISLKPDDYVGAEAILLRIHDSDDLWVW